ncbi:unnamed protein product, partial [Porites evermanni]
MPETVDKDKTWEWTRKGDLKVETGTLIFAAQEPALRTNYVRFNIDKSMDSSLCRLCGQKAGAPNYDILYRKQSLGAPEKYKRRHDNIARLAHWKFCCKYDLNKSE